MVLSQPRPPLPASPDFERHEFYRHADGTSFVTAPLDVRDSTIMMIIKVRGDEGVAPGSVEGVAALTKSSPSITLRRRRQAPLLCDDPVDERLAKDAAPESDQEIKGKAAGAWYSRRFVSQTFVCEVASTSSHRQRGRPC